MKSTINVRVYYEDTDLSGVVYHANYLKFFERGRTENLRLSGYDHVSLLAAEEPLVFTIRRVNTEFIRPARIDDLLEVITVATGAKGARFFFSQEITRGKDVLARAEVEAACMTLEGRPRRLPKALLKFFAEENAKQS